MGDPTIKSNVFNNLDLQCCRDDSGTVVGTKCRLFWLRVSPINWVVSKSTVHRLDSKSRFPDWIICYPKRGVNYMSLIYIKHSNWGKRGFLLSKRFTSKSLGWPVPVPGAVSSFWGESRSTGTVEDLFVTPEVLLVSGPLETTGSNKSLTKGGDLLLFVGRVVLRRPSVRCRQSLRNHFLHCRQKT